jgi:hypothetical protein
LQLDDFNMVSFIPLDPTVETSVELALSHVDNAMQYGEDLEPKGVCVCVLQVLLLAAYLVPFSTEPKDEAEVEGGAAGAAGGSPPWVEGT